MTSLRDLFGTRWMFPRKTESGGRIVADTSTTMCSQGAAFGSPRSPALCIASLPATSTARDDDLKQVSPCCYRERKRERSTSQSTALSPLCDSAGSTVSSDVTFSSSHDDEDSLDVLSVQDRVDRPVGRSLTQRLVHLYASLWCRMANTCEQRGDGFIITDSQQWERMVRQAPFHVRRTSFDHTSSTATCLFHMMDYPTAGGRADALDLLLSDDDDRWISSLCGAQSDSTVSSLHASRSSIFSTSTNCVEALITRTLTRYGDIVDPCVWLAAITLMDVMHRHYMAMVSSSAAATTTTRISKRLTSFPSVPHVGAFQWFRGHELRLLFVLFGIAFKTLTEYYVNLAHIAAKVLPPGVVSANEVPLSHHMERGSSSFSLLPDTLRLRYPHIAARHPYSSSSSSSSLHSSYLHNRTTSPPFTLGACARLESAVLHYGLGFSTVSANDMLRTLDLYCAAEERSLVRVAVEQTSVPGAFLRSPP